MTAKFHTHLDGSKCQFCLPWSGGGGRDPILILNTEEKKDAV